MQDLMLEALDFAWDGYGSEARHPENLLNSRAYWAWLCAQYFSRTAYLIGIDKENCKLLKEEIM